MTRFILFFISLNLFFSTHTLALTTVKGLAFPESVLVGTDNKIYVSQIGEFGKDGDGSVVIIKDGQIMPFASGFDDPKGLAQIGQFIYVADKTRIWKIDRRG